MSVERVDGVALLVRKNGGGNKLRGNFLKLNCGRNIVIVQNRQTKLTMSPSASTSSSSWGPILEFHVLAIIIDITFFRRIVSSMTIGLCLPKSWGMILKKDDSVMPADGEKTGLRVVCTAKLLASSALASVFLCSFPIGLFDDLCKRLGREEKVRGNDMLRGHGFTNLQSCKSIQDG